MDYLTDSQLSATSYVSIYMFFGELGLLDAVPYEYCFSVYLVGVDMGLQYAEVNFLQELPCFQTTTSSPSGMRRAFPLLMSVLAH